ncbi:MAG: hypothetical protein U1F50_01195 [Rubrivivax sp.]
MTYIAKPKLHHPTLAKNGVGYTRRDYEGKVSTLCAGCGHDSISASIIQACWQLDIEPHKVAKLSGIGCSSKTPDYFLGASHGFNTVHGRMPSVLTGAYLANRELLYLERLGRRRPRPPSAWASSRTPCGAACAWSTSWRTTASTASPRASSRRPPTAAAKARRAR